MAEVTRSIVVNAPCDLVVRLSNRLERWPEIMPEYKEVEVVRTEGMKIWFRLTYASGSEWLSWRVISEEGGFAYAERHEPKAPFVFMHLLWLYKRLSEFQTEMVWRMVFEPLDATTPIEGWLKNIGSHTETNQARMKEHIETEYRHLKAATIVEV